MAANFFKKSFPPLRSNLLSDVYNKSPFQALIENALGKTRQILRVFYRKESKLSSEICRNQHRLPVEFFQKGTAVPQNSKFVFYRPGFLHNLTSKWVSDSVARSVSKEWGRKTLQRGSGPMLCFVGFGLAKKPSLLTEEEECEGVSYLIRDSFSTIPWQNIGLNIDKSYGINTQFSIADLKIGDMIAKGCNAAVYSAHFQQNSPVLDDKDADEAKTSGLMNDVERKDLIEVTETKSENLLSCSKLIISHSEGEQDLKPLDLGKSSEKNLLFPPGKFHPYDLAVKIMFNYSAESNAYAIWNAMHKETLPAVADFSFDDLETHKVRKKKLRPHPNTVEMYFAFADQVPLLPGACKNFPQALPVRLLNDGCGRNMTLFLVMKRYHCSLKDYLKSHKPSTQTSLLLFAQLMEALVHLYQSGVAHRDLKTDNVLLDLSQGSTSPKLAVTDFGCCLESLNLNYPSYDISKGGNMALMAPEVVNAEAGPLSVIDYSRSDLWTAGTMAYEIFGGSNPFYSRSSNLKNKSYKENILPALPDGTPPGIQTLVKDMLLINPKQRPSPSFAATVCQILLHAPPDLLSEGNSKKIPNKALEWMFLISAKTYLEGSFESSSPLSLEFELRHTFCSRIQYMEVMKALRYILGC